MSVMSGPLGRFDVGVVGASVAGSIAALYFRRLGARVLVVERRSAIQDYKALCTHFVQPSAIPVLRELKLLEPLVQAGAVRTRAAFWSGSEWIDPPGDDAVGDDDAHAYNIERRILDPMLRAAVIDSGAELMLGTQASDVRFDADDYALSVTVADHEVKTVHARLLVAADGRRSRLAALVANPEERYANDRAASFAYFDGVAAPAKDRSLFLRRDAEMGFVYPLGQKRALLSAYFPKAGVQSAGHGARSREHLVNFIASFPDVPNLQHAQISSPLFGYADYPNILRKPTHAGIAFVGDAALSLDPMSGVGCGFAMTSAQLLARSTGVALSGGEDLAASLERYATAFNELLLPHAHGIRADSLIAASSSSRTTFFNILAQDVDLQRAFIALTGRLISPRTFQQAYLRAAVGKASR